MNRSNHTLFTWTARLFLATGLLCALYALFTSVQIVRLSADPSALSTSISCDPSLNRHLSTLSRDLQVRHAAIVQAGMAGASILYVLLGIKGYRLFSNIAGGTIFTPANAALFRQIGLFTLLVPVFEMIMYWIANASVHYFVLFLLPPIDLGALLAGIVLLCLSAVFGNAAHEKDDS